MTTVTNLKLSKKISIKTLMGVKMNAAVILAHANTKDGSLHVGRVLGIATGLKTGESDFGPYTALTGQFKATNPNTGAVQASGQLFVPDIALDMLIGSVKQGQSVEFAFDFHANIDANSPVGWSYSATPLLNQDHNPLAALEEKMSVPLLAAPTQEKPKGKKNSE